MLIGTKRNGTARRPLLRHPAQVVVFAFGIAILIGTGLLMLPISRTGDGGAPFVTALFTSTSAVCVTGLVTVDTPTYWSGFGEAVILGLIQVGGFGIMTLASLLGLAVFHRLGLRTRLNAAAERNAAGLGEVRDVVKGVLKITIAFEAGVAVLLFLRFWLGYDEPLGRAAYLGLFHAVSAFNNAGFALWSDSLMGFATDPWVCLPVVLAIIAGGLGFPVWIELMRRTRPYRWGLHTKITLATTGGLLLAGTVVITVNEWSNPGTLGPMSTPGKLLAGFFQGVQPRTAGFNSVDYGQMHEGTLLFTDVLMLIGGGSAGTAGGIKVTTFALLFFVIWAEVRGRRDVEVFGRRIQERAIRQAVTVALLAVAVVVGTTLLLSRLTEHPTHQLLFEATSAFGTVGLSTGITASLPASAQLLLAGVMFLGRVGTATLVSALVLHQRDHLYRLPEGRPLIG